MTGSTDPTEEVMRRGDVVPDVPLLDHLGEAWRFSDHRGTPILAILHRHLA